MCDNRRKKMVTPEEIERAIVRLEFDVSLGATYRRRAGGIGGGCGVS